MNRHISAMCLIKLMIQVRQEIYKMHPSYRKANNTNNHKI